MKNARAFFEDNKINSRLFFIKHLIIIFIIVSILGIGINVTFYIFMKNKKMDELVERERRELLVKREQILSKFQDVYSDFLLIMGEHFFGRYLRSGSHEDEKLVERSFVQFLTSKKKYDQIRYINCFGKEKIKITQKSIQNPSESVDYQDKSDRYYFKDALKLENYCLGISNFDLNVEYGEIEIPYKPVIRFFMKMFNPRTKEYGVLIINRLGADIIKLVNQKKLKNLEDIYFIHETGHFIISPNKKDVWGNSIKERRTKTFGNLFPSVWNEIDKKKSGVIFDKDKLFVFNSVYFSEMFKGLKFYSRERYWKIICVIPVKEIVWQEVNSNLLLEIFLIEALIDILLSLVLTILFVGGKRAKYALQRDAYTDPLTNLLNRRFFFKLFQNEVDNAIKNNHEVGIAMGDIDFFKRVNDTYGHEAGDLVLREVSNIIRKITRENDIICRWGGEEIVILFPQSTLAVTTKVIERIRGSIEKNIFTHKKSKIKLTMSFGICLYDKEKNSLDESIAVADKMLYHSKKSGRNRVTSTKNIEKYKNT